MCGLSRLSRAADDDFGLFRARLCVLSISVGLYFVIFTFVPNCWQNYNVFTIYNAFEYFFCFCFFLAFSALGFIQFGSLSERMVPPSTAAATDDDEWISRSVWIFCAAFLSYSKAFERPAIYNFNNSTAHTTISSTSKLRFQLKEYFQNDEKVFSPPLSLSLSL